MERITSINRKKITPLDFLSAGVIILSCIIYTYIFLKDNSIESLLDLSIIFLPIIVTLTLVIHEYIHVIFFKVFGKGKAKIKVIRDKNMKAIIMYQSNKDVFYNKTQTILILLSPLFIITAFSLLLLVFFNSNLLIRMNMILNILGSIIDFAVSMRLLIKLPKDIKINYSYNNDSGVIMNCYK